MDLMTVAKPVFNAGKNVKGYYLAFQFGNAIIDVGKPNLSIHLPFLDWVNRIGLEALTMDNEIFIPVTDIHLATELEHSCSVEFSKVVLLLGKQNTFDQATLQRLLRLKSLGFKAAIFDYYSFNTIEPYLPYVDYLFCSNDTSIMMQIMQYLKQMHYSTKLIATEIDSADDFKRVSAFGIELFDGHFYKVAIYDKHTIISPLQVNYLQLLNQVNQDDFDMNKFAKVVQRDTALTIRFLQMVNTSHSLTGKIKSLRHAAAMIGQNEIKRWITTAVASSLSQDKPGEITRISLLRAKFCENISGLFEMAVHKENLFLMGLFSVLDVVLEVPMDKALDMIIIPDVVKEALLYEKNDFGLLLQFVKQYEMGNWTEVSRTAILKNIPVKEISKAYIEALVWYGKLISMEIDNEPDE